MRPELLLQTKKLLRAMDQFLLHVAIYTLVNLALIVFVFFNISERWGLLSIVVLWAFGLIYHGIRVYGRDPIDPNQRSGIFSVFTKFVGV